MGFDTLNYLKKHIPDSDNQWSIIADAHPTDKTYDLNSGLGVMRYAVEVRVGDMKLRSPSINAVDHLGIRDDVLRLVVRMDDSCLGYVTSFFNVPAVFGSVGKQMDGYIGVDCADLVVGASRKWKKSPTKFTSAAGLAGKLKSIAREVYVGPDGSLAADSGFKDPKQIPFRPGMIVFLDYSPGQRETWDHVGLLFRDDGDGLVGGDDDLLHCGPMEAVLSRLDFPARGYREADPNAPTGLVKRFE
jgi:hypothetical protein